jgi:dTDP-4-amino-4,6-dideoxygalactose transaminase
MAEIQAAYVHAALDGWAVERAEWASARRFVRDLGREFGLDTFDSSADGIDPYWIVRFPETAACDAAETALQAAGIETRRWWSRGCHRMPAYENFPSSSLEVTDDIASRYLGLPFFRGIEDDHRDRLRQGLTNAMTTLQ